LLVPRLWLATTTPGCLLARNLGHSKECPSAQHDLTAQHDLWLNTTFCGLTLRLNIPLWLDMT
ncbi:hypothetical protein L873DRAFT_1804121, partial [Choiromyces venosus 120613-1]